MPHGFVPVRLHSALNLGLDPPFCPCRVLVGTDHTAIDEVDIPVDLAIGIGLHLKGGQHLLLQANSAPVVERLIRFQVLQGYRVETSLPWRGSAPSDSPFLHRTNTWASMSDR